MTRKMAAVANPYPRTSPSTSTAAYCRSGNRSRQAAEYRKKKGYTNLYHGEGGVLAMERAGFPLVR